MGETTKSLFSIHCFGLKFTPKLWSTALTLIIITLFCSLGVWQYHRALYKRVLLANYASQQQQVPVKIEALDDATRAEYTPVIASGLFDTEHQLLVENRFYQHRVGYEVLTPLVLADKSIVLVNRGWTPSSPPALGESKQVSIQGIIHTLPDKIFQIGEAETTPGWPKLIQNSSWREIKRVIKQENIRPFIIVMQKGAARSFTPIYTPSIMPPAKHLGYAFQWFAMALAILVIFVGVNTKRV